MADGTTGQEQRVETDTPGKSMSIGKCPNQWKLDVNDRYQKAVGIVTSLSSIGVAMPIFFLRDIMGTKSIASLISSSVYWGWACLGLSIFSAILYYFASAKWVKHAWNLDADIFWFEIKKENHNLVEKILDWSFFLMMAGFFIGYICILYFMATFIKQI